MNEDDIVEGIDRLTRERDEARAERDALQDDIRGYEHLRSDAADLRDVLLRNGFVPCDITACNCGSWHARFGYPERMQEIKDVLDEAGHPLSNENGNMPLNALRELIAERDALANVLPGHYYMDPPDGGDVPVLEQLRRMAKDAERYRTMKAHIADLLEICALAGTCTDDAPDIFAGLDPSRLDLAMDRLALAQIEQEKANGSR